MELQVIQRVLGLIQDQAMSRSPALYAMFVSNLRTLSNFTYSSIVRVAGALIIADFL